MEKKQEFRTIKCNFCQSHIRMAFFNVHVTECMKRQPANRPNGNAFMRHDKNQLASNYGNKTQPVESKKKTKMEIKKPVQPIQPKKKIEVVRKQNEEQKLPCRLCGESLTLKDLDSHPNKCLFKQIACTYCSYKLPYGLMAHHHQLCLKKPKQEVIIPKTNDHNIFKRQQNQNQDRQNQSQESQREKPTQRVNSTSVNRPIPKPQTKVQKIVPSSSIFSNGSKHPQVLNKLSNHSSSNVNNRLGPVAQKELPIKVQMKKQASQSNLPKSSSLDRDGQRNSSDSQQSQINTRAQIPPKLKVQIPLNPAIINNGQESFEDDRSEQYDDDGQDIPYWYGDDDISSQYQLRHPSNYLSLNRFGQEERFRRDVIATSQDLSLLIRLRAQYFYQSSIIRLNQPSRIGQVANHMVSSSNNDGLKKHQIDRIPEKQYACEIKQQNNEPQNCSICFCELQCGQSIKELHCHHPFHVKCISQWLQRNKTCPSCRQDLSSDVLTAKEMRKRAAQKEKEKKKLQKKEKRLSLQRQKKRAKTVPKKQSQALKKKAQIHSKVSQYEDQDSDNNFH